MRVEIDLDSCLNSGQCAYLQPEIFRLDDDGNPRVILSEVGEEHRAAVQDAATMCPSQSISIVED